MTDYMYLIRGGQERMKAMSESESEQHMQAWGEYMGRLSASGKLKSGAPYASEGMTISGESKSTNGDNASDVGGYVVVDVNDLEEAKSLAQDCPVFSLGGSLEIRECLEMG